MSEKESLPSLNLVPRVVIFDPGPTTYIAHVTPLAETKPATEGSEVAPSEDIASDLGATAVEHSKPQNGDVLVIPTVDSIIRSERRRRRRRLIA